MGRELWVCEETAGDPFFSSLPVLDKTLVGMQGVLVGEPGVVVGGLAEGWMRLCVGRKEKKRKKKKKKWW